MLWWPRTHVRESVQLYVLSNSVVGPCTLKPVVILVNDRFGGPVGSSEIWLMPSLVAVGSVVAGKAFFSDWRCALKRKSLISVGVNVRVYPTVPTYRFTK